MIGQRFKILSYKIHRINYLNPENSTLDQYFGSVPTIQFFTSFAMIKPSHLFGLFINLLQRRNE